MRDHVWAIDPDLAIIPPARRDNSNDLVIEAPHIDPTPQGFYETEGLEGLLLWFKVPAFHGGLADTNEVQQVEVEFVPGANLVISELG